jgi:DNA-binding CsgD family transcriptional regulator
MDTRAFIRRSSLFLGTAFLVGAIFSIGFQGIYTQHWSLGYALQMQGSVILVALLFYACLLWEPLVWMQPVIFLAITPLPILEDYASFYGLGFFTIGMLILFRLDFFARRRLVKLGVLLAYLLAVEVYSALRSGKEFTAALEPLFYMLLFLAFGYLAYEEKLAVFLKEPKAILSLKEKGLSPAERTYLLAVLEGKTSKEIAADFDLADSTIRVTLSNAYKKLGVNNAVELAVLNQRHEIVQ